VNTQPGDCIVCFNKNDIYNVSRNLERLGKEVAVIYGSLPPNTKLAMASKVQCSVAQLGCSVAQLRCSVAQLVGCSVAQLVARWLAVRQAQFESRLGTMEVPPTEPTAVKIWRRASANAYE
jgi:hypothetical protein